MHDETFLVTAGRMQFHLHNGKVITANTGDYVTVPTRSPHTFSNPFHEEAKFFNTFTPAHYINYFKLLATMAEKGVPMNPDDNRRAMAVSMKCSCACVC
jgi:oxalate decarboxylase/phosphoglucose isomerase-like protein (cupin superfamily)